MVQICKILVIIWKIWFFNSSILRAFLILVVLQWWKRGSLVITTCNTLLIWGRSHKRVTILYKRGVTYTYLHYIGIYPFWNCVTTPTRSNRQCSFLYPFARIIHMTKTSHLPCLVLFHPRWIVSLLKEVRRRGRILFASICIEKLTLFEIHFSVLIIFSFISVL